MQRRSPFFAALALAACSTPRPLPVAGPIDLVIAATTDVHGWVRGWNYYTNSPDSLRGLSRVATIVDSLRRAASTYPILVDAGDFLQGNPLAYVAARVDTVMPNPVIAAMNAMQYDAVAIGNHEFNYGLGTLERALHQAEFPLLAANAYAPTGAPRFRQWVFSTRKGIKVAIIGATTPGSMLWDRDHLSGRVTIRDIIPDVRTAVRDAHDAGAGATIVVLHSGLDEPSSYDTASTHLGSENVAARVAHEVPGIDLIVYGHTHKQMADTLIGTTLLMQPRNWATSVAIAHLRMDRRNGRWQVVAKRSQIVNAVHHRESPQVIAVTAEGHRVATRYVSTAVGTTPVPWRTDSARVADTPLIDFILDVERKAAGTQLASTAAFSLDASLPAGPITIARLAALYPYDNTLRAVRITGAQLRQYLEQSARYFRRSASGALGVDPNIPGYNFDIVAGVNYTIDVTKPVGERITQLDFEGRPVVPADTFTLALNNYRQTGGGGFTMLAGAPLIYDRQQDIRQLLVDEVSRTGTLSPGDYVHGNWRIVPPSAIAALLKASR